MDDWTLLDLLLLGLLMLVVAAIMVEKVRDFREALAANRDQDEPVGPRQGRWRPPQIPRPVGRLLLGLMRIPAPVLPTLVAAGAAASMLALTGGQGWGQRAEDALLAALIGNTLIHRLQAAVWRLLSRCAHPILPLPPATGFPEAPDRALSRLRRVIWRYRSGVIAGALSLALVGPGLLALAAYKTWLVVTGGGGGPPSAWKLALAGTLVLIDGLPGTGLGLPLVWAQHRALRRLATVRLSMASVATVLQVGHRSGRLVLQTLQTRSPTHDQTVCELEFVPAESLTPGGGRGLPLVVGDRVVLFGDPAPGEHIIVQTPYGLFLLPQAPLRQPRDAHLNIGDVA